jgi:hypothetical protein
MLRSGPLTVCGFSDSVGSITADGRVDEPGKLQASAPQEQWKEVGTLAPPLHCGRSRPWPPLPVSRRTARQVRRQAQAELRPGRHSSTRKNARRRVMLASVFSYSSAQWGQTVGSFNVSNASKAFTFDPHRRITNQCSRLALSEESWRRCMKYSSIKRRPRDDNSTKTIRWS